MVCPPLNRSMLEILPIYEHQTPRSSLIHRDEMTQANELLYGANALQNLKANFLFEMQ